MAGHLVTRNIPRRTALPVSRLPPWRDATHALPLADVLDHVEVGVVLVDAVCQPWFVNRAAESIVRQRNGLFVGPAGLEAGTPHDTWRLRDLVASIAATGGFAAPGSSRLVLPRGEPRCPLLVRAFSLYAAPVLPPLQRAAWVALFVQDPDREVSLDTRAAAENFGLTPREASVAVMLAEGLSPPRIARALGISIGTVRTHLKHIYGKTATHGQSDIVRLLLRAGA